MVRQLRVEFPGAIYHVVTRGASRNQAERIRRVSSSATWGTHQTGSVSIENTRWSDDAQSQADYQFAIAQADGAKLTAAAEAARARDINRADDDPNDAYNMDGDYQTPEADKVYSKTIADANLSYQTSTANALKTLQIDDANSRATYTTASANLDFSYDTAIAGHGLAYQNSVVDAQRTRAVAAADADKNYLTAQASANASRRTTLATGTAGLQTANAAANFAAYDLIDQQYALPYTAYLRGLAQVQQSVTNQLATASTSLAAGRNAADASYSTAVIPAVYTRDVAFADAAKTRGRSAATADQAASVARAEAIKAFYLDSANPASTYATDVATAVATYSIDVATAEKNFTYDQVDEVAQASTNRQTAIAAATETHDTQLDDVREDWWSDERDAQADLRVASATADRDWSIAILAADKVKITADNNAQKTYRDVQSHAYHASETAWTQQDQAFYLAEINSSAAQSSGLPDPWSVRDDSLRSGRAQSDRDRLAGSLTHTSAAITGQRDIELAMNAAETTLRNNDVATQLTENTGMANAGLDLVTAVANSYRDSDAEGSLPSGASIQTQLSGTLGIAGRISTTMPASGWLAVTDQVIDRMEDWIGDRYSQTVDLELDLPSTASLLDTTTSAVDVATALEQQLNTAQGNVSSRDSVTAIESPMTTGSEGSEDGSRGLAIEFAAALAATIVPKWIKWGAAIASEVVQVVNSSVPGSNVSFPSLNDIQGYTHEYSITPTGSRTADNKALDKLAKKVNGKFNRTLSNGVWHHGAFNTKTGKFTMVLVDKAVHQSISHSGGDGWVGLLGLFETER